MPQRKIFEDVNSLTDSGQTAGRRRPTRLAPVDFGPVRALLSVVLLLVLLVVLVGGMTRHTDSGLSITEWRPISNILPPLSVDDWNEAFASYQQTAEFRLQNSNMGLDDFKQLFWWEWAHRLLGVLTGVVWAAGFATLLVWRKVPAGWHTRILLVGGLGALQGIVGWWMVSSGLVADRVDVAGYRLAVHLLLALALIGLLVWYIMRSRRQPSELLQARRSRDNSITNWSMVGVGLILLQSAIGALLAGADGGAAFPTWPLMNGEVFPSDGFDLQPITTNFLENPSLLHFNHRLSGYLLAAFVTVFWWRSRRSPHWSVRAAVTWLTVLVWCQVVVGIVTALLAVPVWLAMIHQLMAVALLVLAVGAVFHASYPDTSIRRGRGLTGTSPG